MNWHEVIRGAHVLATGIWLGGLVFTTTVVSPAFKRLNWPVQERIAVRSALGRQYARVARINLIAILALLCATQVQAGWTMTAWIELALLVLIGIISELHARHYAPKLAAAARSGDALILRRTLRVSIGVSMLNLAASTALAALALS